MGILPNAEDQEKAKQALYDHLLAHDSEVKARDAEAARKAGRGIKTGIILHNRKVDGTLSPYELYIPKYVPTLIVARTGHGKTTWLTNLAVRMSMNGANGLYITLEDPSFTIRSKMAACYSGILHPNHSADRQNYAEMVGMLKREENNVIIDKFDKEVMRKCRVIDANATINTKNTLNPSVMYDPQFVADLIAHRNATAPNPLDYFIVDFGQLMETEYRTDNSYQRMKAVMQSVKNTVGGFGMAGILGAQLRRETKNTSIWDIQPEDIRDGSDMEQAAKLLLASGFDGDYSDREAGYVLRVVKNSYGPKNVAGMFPIDFANNYIPLDGREPEE